MTRIDRRVLLVVLILTAAPTIAAAQPTSLVCHTIRRGESATQVARRVTGDSRNTYRASFQIMNASSRFVPKSQYDRVRAGWRACVITPAVVRASASVPERRGPAAAAEAVASPVALISPISPKIADALDDSDGDPGPVTPDVLRAIGGRHLTILWLGAAMVVPWFGWRVLDDYLARRKTASVVMRYFADRFISEFERPLLRYDIEEHPLRSRLRFRLRPGRFEILIAPGEGRRYPNLSDHRNNVEYDVARVLDVLGDQSFVSGPLYTHAEWVVVPFQFKARPKQAGVTCISSL
jgi:hypothetical protein